MKRGAARARDALLAIVAAFYGAVGMAVLVATTMPDQPPEPRTCVPLYSETGLECCKET